MRTLFLKIFFSFWLTIVLMGISFYVVALTTRTENPYPSFRHFAMQAMAKYGDDALRAWHRDKRDGLLSYVEKLEQQTGIKLYLFAGGDDPLSGRPVPEKAKDLASRILAGKQGNTRPSRGKWIGRLLDPDSVASGQARVLVMKLPDHPPPLFHFMLHWEWNKIFLYFIIGGLVCYFLSRSLTAPIRKLREATNRIAGGDFSVRVGKELDRKGSEVADLGHDFDIMAERVEGLLLAQRRLLRDISHELRSPLARLNVALELARQRAGEKASPPLARIEKEAERLNDLIGQLLTLNLLESGTEELTRESVDLNALIVMVAEDADFEAQSRKRRVCFPRGEKAMVSGSWELLRRAMENVVRNGVHYTAENTHVEISFSVHKDGDTKQARVLVRDHGPGVPEETLNNIFKPFFRVAEARDRQSGGSGIGLAIADRAVRLHGGRMTAANAEDGGLVVEILLPIAS